LLGKSGRTPVSQKGKKSNAVLGQSDTSERLLGLKKSQIPLRSAMVAKHNNIM
jgi:hypothetical protein